MSTTVFSLRIEQDILDKIQDVYVDEKKFFNDKSDFINKSIEYYLAQFEKRFFIEIVDMITMPFIVFFIAVSIMLFTQNLWGYLSVAVSGAYIVARFYIFFNGNKGVKWYR